LRDWALAFSDHTFGNRFDDPKGTYRVLYAGSQRLACFAETLARFRPTLTVLEGLAAIKGPDDYRPPKVEAWLANRCIAKAKVQGVFADIYASEWISLLSEHLSKPLRELAKTDSSLRFGHLDASILQSDRYRKLTQAISRYVRDRGYDGIYYRSRFGHELENWAIFERADLESSLEVGAPEEIRADDPDLIEILRRFKILSLES
jgi:hypothetical protein